MFQIAVPSVLQQSTVSIGMMIVQAVVNPFGTQALAGYSATMRVENVFFSDFLYSSVMRFHHMFPRTLVQTNHSVSKNGYHAALVLDVCFFSHCLYCN